MTLLIPLFLVLLAAISVSAPRVGLAAGWRRRTAVPGDSHVDSTVPDLPASDAVVALSDFAPGRLGEIVSLDASCRGFMRRRLLDLGFTPGARVRPDLDTFAGDPRAYRVRGTTVALRRDQSSRVLVRAVA